MNKKFYVVISYDISNSKRLNKIAKIMCNYTNRVLYSIFEGELTKDEEEKLKKQIQEIIDPIEDSVRFYHLCNRCKKRIKTSGQKIPIQNDENFKII